MALRLEPGARLVVATHNPGKARELAEILEGRFDLVAAGALGLAEPDETESTFTGNALLKARAAAEFVVVSVRCTAALGNGRYRWSFTRRNSCSVAQSADAHHRSFRSLVRQRVTRRVFASSRAITLSIRFVVLILTPSVANMVRRHRVNVSSKSSSKLAAADSV